MGLHKVRWALAVTGVLAAEAVMIAAAFGWVAVYSHLLNPGQPFAVYQQYAEAASPHVSLILGFPVFFCACRWIRWKAPSQAWASSMALFGIYCLIEAPLVLSAGDPALTAWFAAGHLPTKFLGCYFGGRNSVRDAAAEPA